jgi:hypothetical protein
MWSYSYINTDNTEVLEKGKTIYLGHSIEWEGFGTPKLKKIEFMKNDGTILKPNDEQINVTPYAEDINKGQFSTGTTNEQDDAVDKFKPVDGFLVTNNNFNLVLKVRIKDRSYENNINKMLIKYEKMGLTQEQYIDLEEFIIVDN